ncbi:MAG: DUF4296 domain-containing protein [Saprospiraceae bacterium]|nr:DUF4296 domain-containing protein [Saprospiraceae bacterium]
MKILIYSFIFLSGLIVACRVDTPHSVLSKDQMAALIADVYYMNAVFEVLPVQYRDSIMKSERTKILEQHKISDSLYVHSLKYYNSETKKMEEVERLARGILLKKIEADSLIHSQNKEGQDSIR